MAARLRVARLDSAPFRPIGDPAPTALARRRLVALIRRHLPPATAALLAEPRPVGDGSVVEWYSELAGQPSPLMALPPQQQQAARVVLAERLRSLAELADRLPSLDPGAGSLASELREALTYPGDGAVFVVDGQPVLTFWGYRSATDSPPQVVVAPPAPEAVAGALPADHGAGPRRERPFPPWLWLAALVLLIGAAAWGFSRFSGWGLRWPPWGPDYPKLIQAARDDEEALRARMVELDAALVERLALCAATEALAAARAEGARLAGALTVLEGHLAEVLALCPLRRDLDAARVQGRDLAATADKLAQDLARAVEECRTRAAAERRRAEDAARRRAEEETRRKAEAERRRPPPAVTSEPPSPTADTGPAPSRPARPDGLPPCPGERTAEEAPDVAIVLDASGSMGLPASATAAQIQQQMGRMGGLPGLLGAIIMQQASGPTRLDEAKKGVNNVVQSLPSDVDVGMTVLQRCPRADNLGFFTAAQRGRLYSLVNNLRPQLGTPLAEGVSQAAGMVDGVNAPAIVVVISDGEDSCGGDPCATARALKAQKPLLTINVVDIVGDGAGACMATATGGKVLRPEDGLTFEKSIRMAAEPALKPAHCP